MKRKKNLSGNKIYKQIKLDRKKTNEGYKTKKNKAGTKTNNKAKD